MDVALGRGVSVFLNRMCCLGTQRQPSPQTASFIIIIAFFIFIINFNIIIIIITIGIIIVEEKEGVKGRENSTLVSHQSVNTTFLYIITQSLPPFLHILAQFLNYLHNSFPFCMICLSI